jgi:environmental stress-induced protein Ves
VIWRARDRVATPWKNGGGLTREVGRGPDNEGADSAGFDWRISLADVDASGPFSSYDGVDRVIVLLEGASMRLTVDGVVRDLRPLEPFAFDGAARTHCELPAGPTRDLNVMTADDRVTAAVEILRLGPDVGVDVASGDPLVLLAVDGEATISSYGVVEAVLGPLDALRWAAATPISVRGTGAVAAIRFAYARSRTPRT